MSSPVIALLGTAIFELRKAEPNRAVFASCLTLLARASEGLPQTIEVVQGELRLNGDPIQLAAPGASMLAVALTEHHTARLALPAPMEPRHWREIVEIYAGPSGIYPTTSLVRDAVRIVLPEAEVLGPTLDGTKTPERSAFEMAFAQPARNEGTLTTRGGALSTVSSELARLQNDGRSAVEKRDAIAVANILMALHFLEGEAPSQAIIVAKERQRILPPAALQWLIGEAASRTTPAVVGDALATLGIGLVEPMLEAISKRTSAGDRMTLIDVLRRIPELEDSLVGVLDGGDPRLLKGAVEAAGRCQFARTVTRIGGLLRHSDPALRTIAWRALEDIGTREAIAALNASSR